MKRILLISFFCFVVSITGIAQNIIVSAEEFSRKYYTGTSFEATYECASCPQLSVKVYVNGVLQQQPGEKGARPGKRKFTVSGLPPSRTGTTDVRLVFVDTSGRIVQQLDYKLEYRKSVKALSFLGIGVGNFRDSSIKSLHWPVNDIDTVQTCILNNLTSDYRPNSFITNLTESGTTLGETGEIKASFAKLRDQLKDGQDEEVIVYISGHGKLGPDGEWYYLSSDCSQNNLKYTALSGSFIRDYIASIARKSRVYLFVDACFSAALYEREPIPDNVVFYASSRADESSLESGGWMNSAFTKAFCSAFSSNSTSGDITVKGLFNTITKVVGEDTRNGQHPVLLPSQRYENDVVFKLKDSDAPMPVTVPVKGVVPGLMSIVPGGGQLYKGDYLKSGLFFSGCAVGVGGIIVCESRRQSLLQQAAQTHDINNIKILSSQAHNMLIARNIFIGVTAALYVYNIADASFAPGKRQKVQLTPVGVRVNF